MSVEPTVAGGAWPQAEHGETDHVGRAAGPAVPRLHANVPAEPSVDTLEGWTV